MRVRSLILLTIGISVPFAILILYSPYLIWLLSGFPLGYIPDFTEIRPISLTIYQLTGILNFIQYTFYGGLFAYLVKIKGAILSKSAVVFGGCIVGVVMALITRIVLFITQGPYQLSFSAWVGRIAAVLFTMGLGVILGAIGALVVNGLASRKRTH